ncbi:hypothetical protein PybrP1_002969 [[Pythium] brassicae (nom. inval.)]|nr:hypothetical protein PybrP1_002969 [[Pythium] brassicae (nom. inval.)]
MRLAWGGAHFLLRHVDATLSLRQLCVNGETKRASVRDATTVSFLTPLPDGARLVAASEVSDLMLGVRLLFVVFKAEISKDTSAPPVSSLFVFILRKAPDAAFALQFVNRVDMAAAGASLQVHLVDGPHVVVHDAAAQELSVLALRRHDARFFLWRSGVRVAALRGDSSRSLHTTLRSCVYVGEDASDAPHLLMHFVSEHDDDRDSDGSGCWAAYRLFGSDESAAIASCDYVAHFVPPDVSGTTSRDEHVVCCALLRRADDDFWGSASTIFVHRCGVLLVSCVLPAMPSKILQVDGGDADLLFLAVQCCDVDRSFFLLSFSATALQPSMSAADEVLLVNDVGAKDHSTADDLVLVTKSVLICRKHSSEKYSIHRLRADEARLKLGARERGSDRDDDDAVAASKRGMVQRLDAFVTDEWWGSQEGANADELPLEPQHRRASLAGVSEPEIEMQTLIPGPDGGRASEPVQHLLLYSLKPLVSLARFRVLEFVPMLSLVRIEVVLRNESARSLYDGFVTLVSDAHNELQSSSSVQSRMLCVAQDSGAGLTLLRPTFAIAHLAIDGRECAKYHLSQLHAALPSDVYTMLNPLTTTHVCDVAALLEAVRVELMVLQRRSIGAAREPPPVGTAATTNFGGGSEDTVTVDSDASTTLERWQLLTAFRQLQARTDLHAARVLQSLQKRANFHSMWHASS